MPLRSSSSNMMAGSDWLGPVFLIQTLMPPRASTESRLLGFPAGHEKDFRSLNAAPFHQVRCKTSMPNRLSVRTVHWCWGNFPMRDSGGASPPKNEVESNMAVWASVNAGSLRLWLQLARRRQAMPNITVEDKEARWLR